MHIADLPGGSINLSEIPSKNKFCFQDAARETLTRIICNRTSDEDSVENTRQSLRTEPNIIISCPDWTGGGGPVPETAGYSISVKER